MNTLELVEKLKIYLTGQIDIISQSTPMVSFMKPIITRAMNKNFGKMFSFLDMLSDDQGNINVGEILTEMITNLMQTNPFKFNIPVIGDVEIGDKMIKFNVPFTQKRLVFNGDDIEKFKNYLLNSTEV